MCKSEITKYLKTVSKFYDGKPNVFDFILKHGKHTSSHYTLPGYPAKECYKNAYLVASKYGHTYAEGYAWQHDLIPLAHAWNIDTYGNILDVTWDRIVGCDYYGVQFPLWYIRRMLLKNGEHGSLIDNYKQRWPLITGKHPWPLINTNCPENSEPTPGR